MDEFCKNRRGCPNKNCKIHTSSETDTKTKLATRSKYNDAQNSITKTENESISNDSPINSRSRPSTICISLPGDYNNSFVKDPFSDDSPKEEHKKSTQKQGKEAFLENKTNNKFSTSSFQTKLLEDLEEIIDIQNTYLKHHSEYDFKLKKLASELFKYPSTRDSIALSHLNYLKQGEIDREQHLYQKSLYNYKLSLMYQYSNKIFDQPSFNKACLSIAELYEKTNKFMKSLVYYKLFLITFVSENRDIPKCYFALALKKETGKPVPLPLPVEIFLKYKP